MSQTSKPCPGCGSVPESSSRTSWRSAGRVCGSCSRKLNEHARMLEVSRANAPKDMRAVGVVSREDWHASKESVAHVAFGDVLRSFAPLAGVAMERDSRSFNRPHFGPACNRSELRAMTPAQIDAIHSFYRALYEYGNARFEDGKRAGHNLLVRLAEGSTSVDNFNADTRRRDR